MINVNLLPPDLKEEIADAKKNRRALRNYFRSLGIMLATLVVIAGTYFFISERVNTLNSNLRNIEEDISQYKNLEIKASKAQLKITKIKGITTNSNKWSGILEEINEIIPATITINNLRLDSGKNLRQAISGDAPSREAVVALRDKLEASKMFKYVDIETSTTKQNQQGVAIGENFNISFTLEEGALK